MGQKIEIESLAAKISSLAARPRSTFFELGDALATVREKHSEAFGDVIERAGISVRRAYYLLEVRERFAPFTQHGRRLRAIGWTKLKVLAPAVNSTNIEEMLTLAETMSAQQLGQQLRGFATPAAMRCVLLYLNPADHSRFTEAVLAFGGKRRGKQLIGQEKALMSILSALADKNRHI